jgi:hypothetical protein
MDTQKREGGEQWGCARCGEPIGTYEPIVTVRDGRARRTSKTAEQRGDRLASEHFHEACYLLERGVPPVE